MEVVSLLLVLFCGLSIGVPRLQAEIKTYRNNKWGFEISYNDSWIKSNPVGDPKNPYYAVFFIKRKSTTEPATISISVVNFTGNKERFMQKIRSNQFIAAMQAKMRTRFPDAEIFEHGDS